ncbi:uncharacterized protein LOC123006590 [Tribolium madens]|uniref:uncharacterized protein LOC123006590 n=1 Tax=Tribolium madens TaxID=41895 RepID=UPI001CF749D5|nr:uncharacterized protein LOC123006590 [Tribolium madens]
MCKQLAIVTLAVLANFTQADLVKKFQKLQPPNCQQYTEQLVGLFTLMCNNVAINDEDNLMRDACVGCFQQASTSNNNQPSLTDLMNCGDNYLAGTRYEDCSSQIDANPGTGPCVAGYCRFVTCIRRVNSDLLIAQCYAEASVDNDALIEEDQIVLVKNITSCILARTRCAPINPISGQQQSSFLTTNTYDKWGKPKTTTVALFNSLQITPEGDLRIIQLPGTTKIQNYFCTAQPNLRESSWLEYSC